MPKITIDQFAELTALISAAGLDGTLWTDVLDHLSDLGGGITTHMLGHDFRTSAVLSANSSRLDPDFVRSYVEYYGAINPRTLPIGALPIGRPTYAAQAFADDAMRRTSFYNEWLLPQEDLLGGGGALLFRDSDRFCFFGGLIRERDRAALEDDWLILLRQVTPHLQYALEVNRLLDGRRLDALLAPAGGAEDEAAVLILAADGGILYANPRAAALIDNGGMIGHGVHGHLRVSPSVGRALPEALDALAKGQSGSERHFSFHDRGGWAWQGRTLGFDPRHLGFSPFGIACGLESRCLLVVLRERRRDDGLECRLMQHLGLTLAEARLAVGLADGHDLSELAERQGRSIHTVRNQIKSALWKTGVRRQADLVGQVERIRRG